MEIFTNFIHQGFLAVVPFVLLLGILIFVHELGHFLVAIWNGVRVETFSLGFGKKIFQYKRGDTTYCLSLIPLGGYVKMYGDDLNADIPLEERKHAFTHKKISQRVAIVLAGPLMNFFFAILILFAVAMIGEDVRSPVLGDIEENTALYQSGFRSGDKIVAVNSQPVLTFNEFQDQLTENVNKEVEIRVIRQKTQEEVIVKTISKMEKNPNILSPIEYIGTVEAANYFSKLPIAAVDGESSLVYKAGIRTGDLITKINETELKFDRDFKDYLSMQSAQIYTISVIHDFEDPKKQKNKTYTLNLEKSTPANELGFSSPDLYLGEVFPKSPAHKAGLLKGDKLLSINGFKLSTWDDVLNSIKNYDGTHPVKVKYLRAGSESELEVMPEVISQLTTTGGEEKKYAIGIRPFINISNPETVFVREANPFVALKVGVQKTYEMSIMMAVSFLKLIQNKISPKHIGSVISIGQAASQTFQIGLVQFLQMMAVMSVNLFIINLLPIPILDGGHLLFYTIEAINRKPMSMKKMEIAQQVGLVLLMSLMVFALYNDISKLFSGW